MTFGKSDLLFIICACTAIAFVLVIVYAFLRRYMLRKIFASGRQVLLRGAWRILVSEILILLGVLLCAFALLRPQWGERTRVAPVKGTDVIIVLDVSRSMLASDVLPSRLDRARSAVSFLVNELGGGRFALVVFAGEPFVLCPLTDDSSAFFAFLDSATTESVRRQGTDIGEALKAAGRLIKKKDLTEKYVVLISDGEDLEGNGAKEADRLKDDGVTVFTASIGKTKGDVVKVSESDGALFRNSDGKPVISKADPDGLEKISDITGGSFMDLTDSYSGIFSAAKKIRSKSSAEKGGHLVTEPVERYQVFAFAFFLLLFSEAVVSAVRLR